MATTEEVRRCTSTLSAPHLQSHTSCPKVQNTLNIMHTSPTERYSLTMTTTVSITTARKKLSSLIDKTKQEPVFLTKRQQNIAVLLSVDAYDRIAGTLEEIDDAEAYEAAIAEETSNIPWSEIKAALGVEE